MAVTCQDNDGPGLAMKFVDPVDDFDAIHTGHSQVCHNAGDRVRGQIGEELIAIGEAPRS